MHDPKIPKLLVEEQIFQESEQSLKEMLTTLKSFENNKTPVTTAIPRNFLKPFFHLLAGHFLHSFNEAFHNGHLSILQARGLITLIPKENSSLFYLANWCPITLLQQITRFLPKLGHREMNQHCQI